MSGTVRRPVLTTAMLLTGQRGNQQPKCRMQTPGKLSAYACATRCPVLTYGPQACTVNCEEGTAWGGFGGSYPIYVST
eukprot:2281235-Rhodomonas_salina.3